MRRYWKAFHEKKRNEAKVSQRREREAAQAAYDREQERLSYDLGPMKRRNEYGASDPTGYAAIMNIDKHTVQRT